MRVPALSSLVDSARPYLRSWTSWWRTSRWNRFLVLLIIVYGVTFSVLTVLRILALSAFAWDLGIYNQAMFTTVAYGRFFYISGLPGGPTETLFGGHFSPILFLVLVPYSLYPSPFALVIIQTWAIALAAVPVYLLGQRLLRSDLLAFAFALVFLLDPATQGVNWFDFHVEAFLLVTVGGMLYFYERERWRWFLVFVLLSLSTIEVAAVLVAIVAVGGLAAEGWSSRVEGRKLSATKVWVLLVALGTSAAWAILAGAFVRAMNPQAGYFVGGFGYWDILGASSLTQVPAQALLHPDRALAALTFDGGLKLWYLIVLFAPVQFLTLRAPRAMLYCAPWLVASLLSDWRPYYLVGNHYPSFILPFIFYGAIVGLARPWSPVPWIRRVLRSPRRSLAIPPNRDQYLRVMVGMTLVLLVVVSPLGPWALGSDTTVRAPVPTDHERAVLRLYGLIPPDASALTQNNLYPLLSSRVNVHFVPVNMAFPPGTSFNATMDAWTASVDYILVDCQSSFVEAALLLSWPNVSTQFSVVAAADGAMLLRRGNHTLSLFEPFVRSYGYDGVSPQDASLVIDPAASGGRALFHSNLTTSHFWYGPFLLLPPGSYAVSYRLKVDRASVGPLLGLPVLLHPIEIQATIISYAPNGEEVFFVQEQLPGGIMLTSTELEGASVPFVGAYFSMSQTFEVRTLGAYEFPGHAASGAVQLWFDDLTIVQQTPYASAVIPVRWITG